MTNSPTDPTDSPEADGHRRPIRPADLYRLRAVTDVALHPEGRVAVYQVSWPDEHTDSNRAQLYSIDVDGENNRQLTFGHRDAAAAFSPDGTRLAFLRSEPGHPTSVLVLQWPLGEIHEAASFTDGAAWLSWIDDERLAVTAAKRPADQDGLTDEEMARQPRIVNSIRYRFDGRGYVNDRPMQIYVVDPDGDENPAAVGADGVDHGSVAVSPDGSRLAAVAATDPDADLTGANHVWLHDLTGTESPRPVTDPGGQWESLSWHRDGTLIACGTVDNAVTGFNRPHTVAVAGPDDPPKVERLGDHDLHVVPGMLSGGGAVSVDGGMLFPGVRAGRVAIDRYDLGSGERTVMHEGPHQCLAFDATTDGSVVLAAITSTQRPAELWRVDGPPSKVVSLNEDVLAEIELATTEEVHVRSEAGVDVHAFVIRPPDSAPSAGDRSPGLLYVHGGPMFQYGLGFFDEFHMAAACGYVVVAGNPRGSDGYGERWAQAIVGDLGNKDWTDVQALADHLQSLPEIDLDRIGIGGGSYGGFMTGWALSHDDRFKAGLIERAVTSWNSFYGTSDIGTWFTAKTIGATVETSSHEVTRQSPLNYAADITAPTLIVHSEHDWRCPIEQGEQLFSAIRRAGGDVTMVRFPGESHGLTRGGGPVHRVERFEIVHEFFARHLGGADFGSEHLPAES